MEIIPPSHPADPAVDVRHVSTTSLSTPANTAASHTTSTTITTDSSITASTKTTTVAMAVTVKLHETTQDDSEEHKGSEETRRDEIGEENNGEEVNEHEQLVYETDGGYEHETPKDDNGETHAHGDEQWELKNGKCRIYEREGLKFREDRVHKLKELKYEPTAASANQTMPNATPDKLRQFDWANDNDKSIGPVPRVSDFRPTAPLQPVCTPPRPTVTPSNNDMATCTRTPATGATSNHVPPASIPTKCAPATYTPALPIIHGPRDLSRLCSGSRNPWGSLSRRRQHSYQLSDLSALHLDAPNPWASLCRRRSQKLHQPIHHKPHLFVYPTNSSVHTPLISKPLPSTQIFETVTHPYGIGPSKPVIQVPTRMTGDTPAHLAQHTDRAIMKPATPSPLSHSVAAIRCQCGQFVPVSNTLQLSPSPLHHTLSTLISHFIS
ncbi:hypothetical protein PILCRDRAFT_17416 [Piloderma croceum F 1598]|uniref:Uncharacterized protein n=1 Tax=Piloderma croceum (strain F 1598) TaxID=765440 RepID=A0A0C3ABA2_PILCF|nr:hypothetical protein PILCRDRAFT_17417 [Piloderma croceum F 1598]KIM71068.1 hypothetical protein PILCRDRAFT_17416 [Piloderma croceum F 1598]